MSRPPESSKPSVLSEASEGWGAYTGIGVTFLAEIAIFALIGWWCDGKLDTKPWLLVVGIFFGFGASTYHLVKTVGRLDQQASEKSPPSGREKEDT